MEPVKEKYKAYKEYKDTNVMWIRDLPTTWEISKIKYTTYVKGRIGWQGLRSNEFIDEGPFLVTGTDFKNGIIDWDSCYHISEERFNEAPPIQLKEDDLLITKDGTIGKVAIVKNKPDKAILNSGVFVTRPLNNKYLTRFMYWVLNSKVFDSYITYTQTGSTIKHLYQETYVNFSFPLPTKSEQQKIAIFLDRETAKLDNLVEKKERLIVLLKEKRQAVISQAVTKGLDPKVPMKDSGIEWLGDIPQNWGTAKMKYISSMLRDGTHNPPPRTDKGYPLLSVRNIINNELKKLPDDSMISEKDYLLLKKSFDIRENDLLLAIVGATLGKVAIVKDIGPISIQRSLAIIRVREEVCDYNYLFMFFRSRVFQSLLWQNVGFSAQPGIYLGTLANFSIPIPPIEQQKSTAFYLTNYTQKINLLISKIEQQITKINEYRQSLISAAVTGKIDVRNEV
ncbi:restriction endonuclease subunit S [Salipaludibacillus agaradhaerens]|jgi:type I restriction enzyme S subunit|uniref:restriction endonuclease subunit S n=1 Tax=Salipaludibacillus agaradhaerens TaxID=76935 RepID=UPI0021512BD5|nr:restriction endonuclease subunit S [Salipaludibacillus agaradhaerens]